VKLAPGPAETPRAHWWLRDELVLPLYWLAAALAQRLPLAASYRLATRLADLVFRLVWRERRQIVLANMRQVLGPAASQRAVEQAAQESVRHYARYLVEFLRFPRLSKEEIVAAVGIESWSRFDALLAEGRGVIFVSFHLGNWDLAGAAAGIRGYPFLVVADQFGPPALNALVQEVRRRQGMQLLAAEQGAQTARALLRALRDGQMVGLLLDIPSPEDGVPVQLFGRTAWLPAGPATLALRTGARIVPTAVFRQPDHRFLLVIDDQFDYTPGGERAVAVPALTQQIVRALEDLVRQHPEQWYLFRRLWSAGAGRPRRGLTPAAVGAER
jgi:lauroyl/myristoyl acyltransferase